MFHHFVPSRALHSLAILVRLSLLDLPPENSMKCCPPPACPHAPHGRYRSDERGLAMVSVYSLWKTDNFTGQEDIESWSKKWIENSLLLFAYWERRISWVLWAKDAYWPQLNKIGRIVDYIINPLHLLSFLLCLSQNLMNGRMTTGFHLA